jgi:hypothetical protein
LAGGGEKAWKKYWNTTIIKTDITIASIRLRSMLFSRDKGSLPYGIRKIPGAY